MKKESLKSYWLNAICSDCGGKVVIPDEDSANFACSGYHTTKSGLKELLKMKIVSAQNVE